MGPTTIDGFKFQIGTDNSRKLIIESDRIDQCIKYILDGNSKSITINYFQGYKLDDINFLKVVSNHIEGLHLPETKFDTKIVNTLHKLKFLGIADNKKDVIDLSNFPDLEHLACEYSTRLKGLETCRKLKSLTLTAFNPKSKNLYDLPEFPQLIDLNLFITNVTTLQGIERFYNLKEIEIFRAPKLETISALCDLTNTLEEIQIEQSKKIKDFEILGKIPFLKKIILSESGEIRSLSFIKKLPSLKFISFWGTNIWDGNLDYCEGLDFVGFDNKRHYNHKSEEFIKH